MKFGSTLIGIAMTVVGAVGDVASVITQMIPCGDDDCRTEKEIDTATSQYALQKEREDEDDD